MHLRSKGICKTSILSKIQSWGQTWEVLLEEPNCRAASQAKVSEAAEA
ncbi:hypothetical protein RchiOBHm_Chr1g0361511 [Rosa chinensis]|uniref:Uncharacterized protein n=1 Tax=Rosa chinensis TaxID=74649 RepID=A0A2P6SIY8_ROSCH|nr:hypothetical protein RchiOBHm_Chr1g0361511 [Rosa chinensis]